MFCPYCGNPSEIAFGAPPAEPGEPVEVILARISAERDIECARIAASATRAELASAETIAKVECEAQVESAAAVAAVVTADQEPEETAPEPVIIDAPPPAEVDDQAEDDAPPPADDSHSPRPPAKGRGLGMWG